MLLLAVESGGVGTRGQYFGTAVDGTGFVSEGPGGVWFLAVRWHDGVELRCLTQREGANDLVREDEFRLITESDQSLVPPSFFQGKWRCLREQVDSMQTDSITTRQGQILRGLGN